MGKYNEIQQYYNTLKFKDESKQPYYFDVFAENDDKPNSFTLIIDKSAGRKATGADVFDAAASIARQNGYSALIVKEYKGCSEEFLPVAEYNFRLKPKPDKKSNNNNNNNKQKTLQGQDQNQAQAQPQNNVLGALEAFSNQLVGLGFTGGVSGFIQESAKHQSDVDKLERYQNELQEIKVVKVNLEAKVEHLKEELERYKDQYKDLQRTISDIKHDHKIELETNNKNNSLLSLGINALLGYVAEKTGIGSQLAGLPQTEATNANQDVNNVSLNPIDPEKQKYLDALNAFANDLDVDQLKKFSQIAQFISVSAENFEKVINFCNQ